GKAAAEVDALRSRAEAAEQRADRLAAALRQLCNGVEALLAAAAVSRLELGKAAQTAVVRDDLKRRLDVAREALRGTEARC
ncbi:MAG TPA: hypothetical protein VKU88_10675, partial [Acidimicrobiales bacterium]|nr:hypothetical protein [Acidimicrobiales bacterium]